jgi:hypothetical protein
MSILGAKYLAQPLVSSLFPVSALAVTVIKRDKKGNLIALGIDVVSVAVFLFFRTFDVLSVLFLLASFIFHAVRAEKIHCYDRIKNLYGFSRFNSFDICNQVLGDTYFADSVIESYEEAFDDSLMRYERSSHYVPPVFKKIQVAAIGAVLAGVCAAVFSSAMTGKVKGAENVTSISDRTGGAVKGTITRIFDVQGVSIDGTTDDQYWVTFGKEQVSFSVPGSLKSKFASLNRHQHPEQFDDDDMSVEPSSEPIEFVGEICRADDSKYSDENIKPSKQALEKSDLPFNTKYYVKIYSISFYKTIQKVGIALIIIGAAAWAATILLGSLENRRY